MNAPFRLSFRVSTKLLVSVLALLCATVVTLDYFAISLLVEDKRAFVYEAQSDESLSAGRDIVGTSLAALDILRVALGSTHPNESELEAQRSSLQLVVNNQSKLPAIALYWLDPSTGIFRRGPIAHKDSLARSLALNSEDLEHLPWQLQTHTKQLLESGYLLMNGSRQSHPLLGIALADKTLTSSAGEIAVALGFVSMKEYGPRAGLSRLSVATPDGTVIFDSDPGFEFSKADISADPVFLEAMSGKISSGAAEYKIFGQRILGTFAQPGLGLLVITRTEWSRAMRAAYLLTEKFVLLGTLAGGVSILLVLLLARSITAPVQRLYLATEEIGKGDFDISLAPSSRDEIGGLTVAFNLMASKIKALIAESVRKAHLENQLAIASAVQQTLIPEPFLEKSRYTVRSHYQSAEECGGDWWGVFEVEDKACILIADATGHGLPSALITAAANSCFSLIALLAEGSPRVLTSPGKLLAYANRAIFDSSKGRIQMSFFAGVIDFKKQEMTFANAGHPPPWLVRRSASSGEFELQPLLSRTRLLGEERSIPSFKDQIVSLVPGDQLVLYTDGLLEALSPEGKAFGKMRARQAFLDGLSKDPKDALPTVLTEFREHTQGAPLDDDLTVIAVELTGG